MDRNASMVVPPGRLRLPRPGRSPRMIAWAVAALLAWQSPGAIAAQAPEAAAGRPSFSDLVDPSVAPAATPEGLDAFPPPPPGPPGATARVQMSPFEVIRESIFGPASKEDWKPLTLGTFFSEGWDQPFTNAPEGTNGAPKQNWIGAPAGVFGRFATLNTFYTNHLNFVPGLFLTPNTPFMPVHPFTNGNQYAGYGTILLPLNARMEIELGTVFIASNKSSPAGGYVGNWGDTGVQARFHLADQRNFSLVGLVGERIPTGKSVNGNNINYVTPGLEFWWNFAPKWVARGQTAVNILTGRKSSTSVYVNQLTVGRYFTTKDAAFFKELEVHLTASALSDVSGGAHFVNDIYLFPGFRFGLGKGEKWYALGGVNVPVSGPQPYVYQPQFSITRNY